MGHVLVAREILVERDQRRVVDCATIELDTASVNTIAGPSGCGKSTLLRAMASLIPVQSGVLSFEEHTVAELGVAEFRRRVAYVAQSPRMFDGTVGDNLRTGPGFRGEALDDDRVAALLARVGLDAGLMARAASGVSGGERLRVALARALANEPRVLLLDEPTASLDPSAARVVLDLLIALANRGAAVLVVTHVEEHAAHLGGVAYRMTAGRLAREPMAR